MAAGHDPDVRTSTYVAWLGIDAAWLAFALYEPGDIHRTGGYSTHQIGSVNWAC